MTRRLMALMLAIVLVVVTQPLAQASVVAQEATTQFQVTINSAAHQTYGLYYPVTYMFQIPSGSSNLTAQYTYAFGDSWHSLSTQTPSDFFNGINAARFDYANDVAYLSIAFSPTSDLIFLRILDGQTELPLTYLGMPLYYDNRRAAVTVTLDDLDGPNNSFFGDADAILSAAHVHYTAAVVTGAEPNWISITNRINAGYMEAASHSRNHPLSLDGYASTGYDLEILGSRDDILENLEPTVTHVPVYIEPSGLEDAQVRQAIVDAHYLVARGYPLTQSENTFSTWGSDGAYERVLYSYDTDNWPWFNGSDQALLVPQANSAFDATYQAGGIYHLMDHPWQQRWEPPSYLGQHITYISNRLDVWYAAFGELYLYHYVQERGQVSVLPVGSSPPAPLSVFKSGGGSGTVSSTPAGIACGSVCSADLVPNTVVTLTAAADAGSTFAGWSGGDCSSTSSCIVTMDATKSVTATFILNVNTLTVNKTGAGSGTVSSTPAGIACGATCTADFDYGAVVTVTATPNLGSSFAGWSPNCAIVGGNCAVIMTADTLVTATFTLNTYTLTVATAGNGSGTTSHIPPGSTFTYGTVVTVTATPNLGSSFAGWSPNCTPVGGNCVVTMTAHTFVTATFTLNTYTLTMATAGNGSGTTSNIPPGSTFTYGTVVTVTATPNLGSTFAGWSPNCTPVGSNCVVTLTTNTLVTATFTLNTYTLTVAKAGNGSGATSNTPPGSTFTYGTLVTVTATPNLGSTFAGWSPNCAIVGGNCVVTLTTNTRVTATFTLNTYTLTVAKAGNGSGATSNTPPGSTFTYGTLVTVTATPNLGSTFAGWSPNCAIVGGNCGMTMTADTLVTATFTLNTYTLTVATAGTGSGITSNTPPGGTFTYGTVVTVTATPNPGSTFTGWSGACSGIGPCVVAMNTHQSVTATFTLNPPNTFALSVYRTGNGMVTSLPAGIDCGVTCAVNFTDGAVVTVTATPNLGSSFAGWSPNCTPIGGNCVVTMTAHTFVTVTFTLNTYTLTVATVGNGSGATSNNPPGSTFNYGTLVTVTATPNLGSSFAGWSLNCAIVGGNCVVTMTADTLVTATFTLNTYALTVATAGNGFGTTSNTPPGSTFNYGTVVTVTATPNPGSPFVGWSPNCTPIGGNCVVTMTANTLVTATFTLNTYALTVATAGNGSGTTSNTPPGSTFNYGTVVTVTATPNPGSSFAGWSPNCTLAGGNCRVTMSADTLVTATFSLNMYTLTVATAGNGSGITTNTPPGSTFTYGTLVTVTASPNPGSTFTGWSGACLGIGPCVVTMNTHRALTATFTLNPPNTFALSVYKTGNGSGLVTSLPAGINCGATCTANFIGGTVVTLTATPMARSSFTGWSGDCSGTVHCTVTLTANTHVTATFSTFLIYLPTVMNNFATASDGIQVVIPHRGDVNAINPIADGHTTERIGPPYEETAHE